VNQPLLYRPEAAAEVLAISRAMIFKLMASGQLESISIGRSRRITREALSNFVEARAREAVAE